MSVWKKCRLDWPDKINSVQGYKAISTKSGKKNKDMVVSIVWSGIMCHLDKYQDTKPFVPTVRLFVIARYSWVSAYSSGDIHNWYAAQSSRMAYCVVGDCIRLKSRVFWIVDQIIPTGPRIPHTIWYCEAYDTIALLVELRKRVDQVPLLVMSMFELSLFSDF